MDGHFDENHAAVGGEILQFLPGFGILIVVGHNNQPAVRMSQVVYHALNRSFRVDQHRNRPGKNHTPQGNVPVGTVLTKYRDFISDPDALDLNKPYGKIPRPGFQLLEGKRFLAIGPDNFEAFLVQELGFGKGLVEDVDQGSELKFCLHLFFGSPLETLQRCQRIRPLRPFGHLS